ncbi:MFS transporter [Paenibacillus aestuarii]|uniref:MFS transporter n=1 Tax=Paenibacillus aestuarii TaxID=516965 RepID=A0ABW0KGB6_9BACL|nr:MFS transporter [Paenibacillus aestuarii]
MHRMIYLLALGVFLTATSELIISGILPQIAEDLNISLAVSGQLVSVYSLSFAIGTPLIVSITSRIKRNRVLTGSLILFLIGSLIAFLSTDIVTLMLSRVLLGITSGVYLVAVFSSASKMVKPEQLGRAISTIVLGFSSAMILGVPIGIALANWFHWQTMFLILGVLTLLILYPIARFLPDLEGDAPVSFFRQFKVIVSMVIAGGFLITFLRESGNAVFFTYMVPYIQEILRFNAEYSSVIMLGLGLLGATGARLGGFSVDHFGTVRTISISLIVHITALASLFIVGSISGLALFLLALLIMSMFIGGTAMQSYFIQKAPQSSNFVLSLNTSIVHLGLAAGTGTGGYLLESSQTLAHLPLYAAIILSVGLLIAGVVFTRKSQ